MTNAFVECYVDLAGTWHASAMQSPIPGLKLLEKFKGGLPFVCFIYNKKTVFVETKVPFSCQRADK